MSTAVQPQNPAQPNGTSPSSGAPSGAPAASPPSSDPTWRAPETAPAWARGKTPEELLGIASQLEGALENYVQNGAPSAPPALTPVAPVTPQGFAEDEYVRGADLNRMAPRIVDERIDSRVAGLNAQLANIALDTVRKEFNDDFNRFGPEIYGKLSTLDKASGVWTVDNLRTVVKLVRADHVDELVRDKLHASSLMEPALRSTGAAPVSVTPPATDFSVKSEQLSPDFREKLAKAGVTEATMDDFCRAAGMTREQYFQMASKNQIITEAPRR